MMNYLLYGLRQTIINMASQKSFRSNGGLKVLQQQFLQVPAEEETLSKYKSEDGKLQIGHRVIIGNLDEFYLQRENEELEGDILRLIDQLEEQKQTRQSTSVPDQKSMLNPQLINIAIKLLGTIRQSQRVNQKIIMITKMLNNKNNQLKGELQTIRQQLQEAHEKMQQYQSASTSQQIKRNSKEFMEIGTDPVELQQPRVELCHRQLQTKMKDELSIQGVLSLVVIAQSPPRMLQITPQSSLLLSVKEEEKLQTQITEEDEPTTQQIYSIQKAQNQTLTTYFKQISSSENQVSYSQHVIDDLQKLGKHSEVARAFIRLLKQHRYLKVCLQKSLETDHQAEEQHNDRILQIYHEARQQVDGRRFTEDKKQQCSIY